MATKFVSQPIRFPDGQLNKNFTRADLEFHQLDHSGASYEARVFLNNPDADESTPTTEENGFVDSFYIFGHGGCFGDIGHCDVPTEPRRPFDLRPPHPLTPAEKRIIITDALHKIVDKTSEITVTVVPVIMSESLKEPDDVLQIKGISLITYD